MVEEKCKRVAQDVVEETDGVHMVECAAADLNIYGLLLPDSTSDRDICSLFGRMHNCNKSEEGHAGTRDT